MADCVAAFSSAWGAPVGWAVCAEVHQRAAAAIEDADSGSNHGAGVDGDEDSAADRAVHDDASAHDDARAA